MFPFLSLLNNAKEGRGKCFWSIYMLEMMYIAPAWLNEYVVLTRANDLWVCNVVGFSLTLAINFGCL